MGGSTTGAGQPRANSVIPIDTIHINICDLEHLDMNLVVVRNLGFEGSLFFRLKEVLLAHKNFSPTPAKAANSKEVLRSNQAAAIISKGVVLPNGKLRPPDDGDRQESTRKTRSDREKAEIIPGARFREWRGN